MTQNQAPTSFMEVISKHLPLVEKILLTALVIGIILRIMHLDSSVTKVALLGLGVTFFLLAFQRNEIAREEGEQLEFSDLLALSIVPKILWISSAVSALGLAFYLFDFGNDGYKRLLTVGGMSIGMGTVIILISITKGVKHLETVTPFLLRALPLLLADFYILFR